MTQTPKTKTPYGGGWLIREDESIDFDRQSAKIDNSANTADVVIPPGHPFKTLTSGTATSMLMLGGELTNANNNLPSVGAIIEPTVVRAGEIKMVAVAARGLNVINTQQLPINDYLGTAFTGGQAALATRFNTDLKWVARTDPSGAQAAPGALSTAAAAATGGEQQT